MLLITRNVKGSCMKLIEAWKDNCSGFVRAVADDLMLFVPGISGNADEQVDLMTLLLKPGATSMRCLGDGKSTEPEAVQLADGGDFVICGMTSQELQVNRPNKKVKNGHVSVLIGGFAKTGWPLGYWGSEGGAAGKGESLSLSFRATDRDSIHYFAISIPRE
jgi:hypothetical protein